VTWKTAISKTEKTTEGKY